MNDLPKLSHSQSADIKEKLTKHYEEDSSQTMQDRPSEYDAFFSEEKKLITITEVIVTVKVDGVFREVGLSNAERMRVYAALPKPLTLSGPLTSPELIENDNPIFINQAMR